ncbi:hypothetical protein LZ31DRAFT_559067 [Colletotrichum somersetense]|nr:hypothetical protein LZ31DRAFT_559067 [Colletotrichum somersetense]
MVDGWCLVLNLHRAIDPFGAIQPTNTLPLRRALAGLVRRPCVDIFGPGLMTSVCADGGEIERRRKKNPSAKRKPESKLVRHGKPEPEHPSPKPFKTGRRAPRGAVDLLQGFGGSLNLEERDMFTMAERVGSPSWQVVCGSTPIDCRGCRVQAINQYRPARFRVEPSNQVFPLSRVSRSFGLPVISIKR